MANGRSPPHSIESEESVLGALLIDGSTIEQIADSLDYNDFYYEGSQLIYHAALDLYQRGEPINQISLAQELNNKGKLEFAGGVSHLSYLVSICATTFDIKQHADTVHKLAKMRQLIAVSDQITAIGYNTEADVDQAVDQARTLIDSLKTTRSKYLELKNLRILKSKPPHYQLNVNGTDLSLSLAELQQWGRFRTRIMSELDFIPIKPKNWDATVNRLLEYAQKMEAPVDTSAEAEVKLSVRRWFEQRGEGEEYSDIQAGCYAVVSYLGKETGFEKREFWAFQPTPLLRWLKRDTGKMVARDSLWSMAVGWGAIKHQWRIGKNQSIPVRLWAVPPTFAESVEFAIEKEEKQEEMEMPREELPEELPDI